MAIVPIENPGNVVAPTESPATSRANDYQHINVPENDPIPVALQHFGDTGVNAGEGLAREAVAVAGLNNETAARDESTKAMASMATRAADFFTKKGQNAVADYPNFIADIQSMQKDAMGRMTNPQATNMLGASMAPLMRHYTEAAATHLKTETINGSILSSTSRIDGLVNQAVVFRDDPKKVSDYIDGIAGEVHNLGQINGWDDATLNDKIQKATGAAYLKVIESLAVSNPLAAQAMFDQKRNFMDAGDALRVSEFLKPKVDKAGDETWLQSQVGGNPTVPANTDFDKMWNFKRWQESRGHQTDAQGQPLTSSAGAIGISQIKPGTAQWTANQIGVPYDENRLKTDPAYNEAMGKAHFRLLLQNYGDPTLAAAAYAGGMGNTNKWIQTNGDPRTGAISAADWAAKIPNDEARKTTLEWLHGVGIDSSTPAGPGTPRIPRADLVEAARTSSPDIDTQLRRMAIASRYTAGLEHQDAQARASLTHELENNVAPQLHAGVDGVAIPETDIRRLFPAEQAERVIADLKYTQMSGRLFKSVSMASPDEIQQMRQDLISGQGVMSNMLKGKGALLQPPLMTVGSPDGLVQGGNIDLAHRPVANNPDGSISTVRSITITDDKNHAVLIPTVVAGKVVSNDEAIAHYKQTGEHLGTFDTEAHADKYAESLHEQQAATYSVAGSRQADYKLKQQMAQELETRVLQRDAALKEDPAAYVASNDPGVRSSLQAATQGNDPNALQSYATATIASQARLGVTEGHQQLLPLNYIDQLASKFKSEDPSKEDPGAAIQSLAQQWGSYWPKVYGELVTKGHLPDEAAVTAVLDAPGQSMVRQDYVRAWQAAGKKGEATLENEIDPQAKAAINKDIDGRLNDFRGTLLVPGVSSAQNVQAYSQFRNGVKMLASYYAMQGKDGDTALTQAIDGMINLKWDLGGGTYRTPKGMLGPTETATQQAERGLTTENVRDPGATPGSKEAALDPNKRTELWLGGKKMWVNNEAGDGVVLRVLGRDGSVDPIFTKDGKRIELKFADIAKQPAPMPTMQTPAAPPM